uniref:Uncharacterized protein n=1 Tax=uncultured Acidobacteriota bacterium TaxID=171953 RepID=H5SQ14_9BACT|nr:hypothetical protein HGMM_F55E10C12 [uncultured Acidobacteriota bacterium]
MNALTVALIATVCGTRFPIIAVLGRAAALPVRTLIVHCARVPIVTEGAVLSVQVGALTAAVANVVGALVVIIGAGGPIRFKPIRRTGGAVACAILSHVALACRLATHCTTRSKFALGCAAGPRLPVIIRSKVALLSAFYLTIPTNG